MPGQVRLPVGQDARGAQIAQGPDHPRVRPDTQQENGPPAVYGITEIHREDAAMRQITFSLG